MGSLHSSVISNFPMETKIFFGHVDDTLVICNHGEQFLTHLLQHLDSIHPIVPFIIWSEENIMVSRKNNKLGHICVPKAVTHTDKFLYHNYQPSPYQKQGIMGIMNISESTDFQWMYKQRNIKRHRAETQKRLIAKRTLVQRSIPLFCTHSHEQAEEVLKQATIKNLFKLTRKIKYYIDKRQEKFLNFIRGVSHHLLLQGCIYRKYETFINTRMKEHKANRCLG